MPSTWFYVSVKILRVTTLLSQINKTNDLILNLTPENVTQHAKEAQHPLK